MKQNRRTRFFWFHAPLPPTPASPAVPVSDIERGASPTLAPTPPSAGRVSHVRQAVDGPRTPGPYPIRDPIALAAPSKKPAQERSSIPEREQVQVANAILHACACSDADGGRAGEGTTWYLPSHGRRSPVARPVGKMNEKRSTSAG